MIKRERSQGKPRGKGAKIHLKSFLFKSFLFKDIALLQLPRVEPKVRDHKRAIMQYEIKTLKSSGISKIYANI